LTQGENVNPCSQKKTKKENSQSKAGERAKKGKKIPDQTSKEKEMCRKVFGPDNV